MATIPSRMACPTPQWVRNRTERRHEVEPEKKPPVEVVEESDGTVTIITKNNP